MLKKEETKNIVFISIALAAFIMHVLTKLGV